MFKIHYPCLWTWNSLSKQFSTHTAEIRYDVKGMKYMKSSSSNKNGDCRSINTDRQYNRSLFLAQPGARTARACRHCAAMQTHLQWIILHISAHCLDFARQLIYICVIFNSVSVWEFSNFLHWSHFVTVWRVHAFFFSRMFPQQVRSGHMCTILLFMVYFKYT